MSPVLRQIAKASGQSANERYLLCSFRGLQSTFPRWRLDVRRVDALSITSSRSPTIIATCWTMSTLEEYVDRLSNLASSICTSASAAGRSTDNGQDPSSSAGPFTRAVLETPLGDLIRDIDESEIGLFTLVQPSTHSAAPTPQEDAPVQKAEIARVSLPVATPLRRPPPASSYRREDGQRPGDHEPEVYANAALKFLDRYQSIRHMPRYQEQAEHIIGELSAVRRSLSSLNEELKQAGSSSSSKSQLSPRSLAQEEERRIAATQARINELKERKEALLHKQQLPSST
ncbi:hypothetical protein NM688_g6979 [Phlebia brevispora]|uniref:Uncharacterized protein n=1 Tax=Phlebia brevispora TaxID=194682 RepID=A0ACC1SAI6_9APHY|nr:hypothetical protein NM688_g6979 [Phlebia brevispora]